jgi:peptide/nickel transport system substrate-binding protein
MLTTLLTACGPVPGTPGSSQTGSQAAPAAPKVLAIGLDEDLKHFWDALTGGGGTGARELANLINQHIAAIGGDGVARPRLVVELPSQDKGTWKVLTDGTMETTLKLRPGITWHDGTPFTADDVIFSWQVNRDPDVPNANQEAVKLIKSIEATDPLTVVMHWGELYAFADRLEHRELFPLPKHLLEQSYRETKDQFLNSAYFNTSYVGLGPFRVTNWDFGSGIETAAYDGFFLGRPKIDVIRVRFIPDNNTMLANLRARSIQMMLTLGNGPDLEAMTLLKQEWESTGYGTMYADPISWLFAEPQKVHNPQPSDLVNPKLRQAFLLALDRQSLVQATTAGLGLVADSWVHPSFSSYSTLQSVIARYPYDPRRASEAFAEAGWTPGPDGVLEKNGQRLAPLARTFQVPRELLITVDGWKRSGVAVDIESTPEQMLRDREFRASFTGFDFVSNPMGAAAASRRLAGYNTPTAENKWTGTNRGGYTNPAWDDLDRRINIALQDGQRRELERELVTMFTAELPVLPITYKFDIIPIGGGLSGVQPVTAVAHRGFILHTWNAFEWDMQPKGQE